MLLQLSVAADGSFLLVLSNWVSMHSVLGSLLGPLISCLLRIDREKGRYWWLLAPLMPHSVGSSTVSCQGLAASFLVVLARNLREIFLSVRANPLRVDFGSYITSF